jgi:hypothetical protein
MGCKGKGKKSEKARPGDGTGLSSSMQGIKGIVLTPELTATPLPASAPPLELKFDWQAPCALPAVATLSHSAGFDELSFVLNVKAAEGGFDVEIDKLEVTGRTAESKTNSFGRKIVSRTVVLPHSRVSADGAYLETHKLEEFTNYFLKHKFSISSEYVKARDVLPNKSSLIRNSAMKQWDAWISSWIGQTWVPGKANIQEGEVPSALAKVSAKIRREHLGQVKGHPKLFLLEIEAESRGTEVEAQVLRETRELLAARGKL